MEREAANGILRAKAQRDADWSAFTRTCKNLSKQPSKVADVAREMLAIGIELRAIREEAEAALSR